MDDDGSVAGDADGDGDAPKPCKAAKQQGINDVLTDDLLLEILFRLPSKLAIRSKSVCTRWNALISNPCLIERLIAHHYQLGWNSQEALMIHEFRGQLLMTRYQPDDLPLSAPLSLAFLPCFQGEKSHGAIVSSCNGLLLCCSDRLSDEKVFYVCNPFTRQWVATPPSPGNGLQPLLPTMGRKPIGFICDPFYRVDDQGCVSLNPICRFKIFCPYRTTTFSDMNFDMDIFSSGTGEWSNIKISRQHYRRGITFGLSRVVVHNGKLYFQLCGDIVVYDPSSCKICGDLNLPEDLIMGLDPHERLSSSRGSLWTCRLLNGSRRLRVWRLNEEQESSSTPTTVQVQSWSFEREVHLSMCSGLTEDVIQSGRVLALHPDDPDILLLYLLFKGVNVSWNLRTGAVEVIGSCQPYLYTWADSFFVENPVWPTPVPYIGTPSRLD